MHVAAIRICKHTNICDTYSSSSVAVSVAGVGDHDIRLFAISCIHKHLRTASSQPGCYTVLYFILWRPLLLFPSIFPVVNKCSSFPYLITWPRNSACLLLTLLISFLVLLTVFRISKLVLFSVHDTLSILLKNHISIASMDVNIFLSLTMIHIRIVVWAQCNTAGHAFSLRVIYVHSLKCISCSGKMLWPEPFSSWFHWCIGHQKLLKIQDS